MLMLLTSGIDLENPVLSPKVTCRQLACFLPKLMPGRTYVLIANNCYCIYNIDWALSFQADDNQTHQRWLSSTSLVSPSPDAGGGQRWAEPCCRQCCGCLRWQGSARLPLGSAALRLIATVAWAARKARNTQNVSVKC